VVLGSRFRPLLPPVLTEGHFDIIDSRARHLNFGYVLSIEALMLPRKRVSDRRIQCEKLKNSNFTGWNA
jgi:hypothetical protein